MTRGDEMGDVRLKFNLPLPSQRNQEEDGKKDAVPSKKRSRNEINVTQEETKIIVVR